MSDAIGDIGPITTGSRFQIGDPVKLDFIGSGQVLNGVVREIHLSYIITKIKKGI